MTKLKNKVAIITGSGTGLGRAGAMLFAREGAKVVVAEISRELGEETVSAIKAEGNEALFVPTDVSDAGSVAAMVMRAVETFGRVDVLYNNAGGSSPNDGPVTDVPVEEFWRTMKVDLFGTFLCCKYTIPAIIKTGGGAVINTTSTVALRGIRKTDAYTAAKGGILSLTQSMAVNYADHNIRVNAIAPGGIRTERVQKRLAAMNHKPEGKSGHLLGLGEPMNAATAALFLASDDAAYVTGIVIPVDGGWCTVGPSI
jgi:NAD(P)-dependent dehydrogenase (short-subunit alcohol dehydrogenase family)